MVSYLHCKSTLQEERLSITIKRNHMKSIRWVEQSNQHRRNDKQKARQTINQNSKQKHVIGGKRGKITYRQITPNRHGFWFCI